MNELTGKHALVTGGGTGIGLAIATSLAGVMGKVTLSIFPPSTSKTLKILS